VDPGSISDPEYEALAYYAGLPSAPQAVLVCRTGNTSWKRPTGPEAYRVLMEAKPVFDHQIATVWDNLGPKVPDYLDSVGVTWSSIDVVRFANVGEDSGSVVLWIGVKPQCLSGEDARLAVIGCRGLLRKFEITDADVEFRESVFTRSAGPKHLGRVPSYDATADVRGPLTPALCLPIASRATPYTEGTGGIYISEGGDSKRVFVLTARH
jgi:hypothetical protein